MCLSIAIFVVGQPATVVLTVTTTVVVTVVHGVSVAMTANDPGFATVTGSSTIADVEGEAGRLRSATFC